MDGVTFCGNCGAQMESHIPTQTPETPQQNVPEAGVSNQQVQQPQPYQQQQSYQQTQQQSYGGGQPGGPRYTNPSGGPSNGGMVPPKNYMVESIVVTVVSFLCCCSPISVILGIIAIIKANNVNPEFERGNINEAIGNADSAKKLTIWAAIIAVAFYVIFLILYFLFFAAAIAESGGWDSFLNNM
jgi:hypothetical protein